MVYTAIGINVIIALAAYRKKSVSKSGGLAGAVVGTGIWIAGGLLFWGLLIFFFVSSSILSRIGKARKLHLERIHEKGDKRDGVQVWANAGIALTAALLYGITSQVLFMCTFSAAMAAATADTWASEIGVLSRKKPVSIVTGKKVDTGISGGITALGTFVSFLGALCVALIFSSALVISNPEQPFFTILAVITFSGFGASLIDSLLGSTVQIHYIHHGKGIITEKRELYGEQLARYRGVSWITNDTVNALSSLFAAVSSTVLYLLVC